MELFRLDSAQWHWNDIIKIRLNWRKTQCNFSLRNPNLILYVLFSVDNNITLIKNNPDNAFRKWCITVVYLTEGGNVYLSGEFPTCFSYFQITILKFINQSIQWWRMEKQVTYLRGNQLCLQFCVQTRVVRRRKNKLYGLNF